MGVPENINWSDDPYWRRRRLSPAQLLIHDIHLEPWRPGNGEANSDQGPWLEINETLPSTLIKDLQSRDLLSESLQPEELSNNRQEQSQLKLLSTEYGWMNCLRNKGLQKNLADPAGFRKVRWIHLSSKFTEYLEGCLLALSDWGDHASNGASIMMSLRQLGQCIYENERFSKHGRYFSPFYEPLSDARHGGPMLISVPFLDWSTDEPPPLRFQIDPREGFQSSRSTAHIMRTILQHFYRLEDTSDREHQQVFAKHRPWLTDRELDLKVRRWYGQYPSRLNVDELWILIIDSSHIVTFASNQSWKSRWPPLQLAYRVAEISFRGIRNSLYLNDDEDTEYTAYTHALAVCSGALGLLHRNFWTDLPLCLTDRFSSYASNAQYRLLRSPSAKLVMDLLHVQEELNIITQIMQQQIELISGMQSEWELRPHTNTHSRASSISKPYVKKSLPRVIHHPARNTFKQFSTSVHSDPMHQLLENLRREYTDLCELKDNCNNLINRTIQLVNIRLEDHGKAILVFTIVTIVFLPLSFVTSFFGMNTVDIRNMDRNQGIFWIVALSVTVAVVGFAVFLAFYGAAILEAFLTWKANRQIPKPSRRQLEAQASRSTGVRNFEVLNLG